MAARLEVKEVHQSFATGFWLRPAHILRGVSLEVPQGSVYGFLGANGAGKTTLIHLITGLRKPKSGSLTLDGLEVRSREARARLGYLPERPYFHEHLTGEGLLQYFGALSNLTGKKLESRITEVLDQVNLRDARRVRLRNFSKGMLQRLGLAQAVLHEPDFLVLDEPMSGLDPLGRKDIRELILRQAELGKTVFFSTHVISDVETLCDRVGLISKGQMVRTGKVAELLSERSGGTEVWLEGESAPKGAESWTGVDSVRVTPDGVRLLARSGTDLGALVTELRSQGAKLRAVLPVRPSLEDYFGSIGRKEDRA